MLAPRKRPLHLLITLTALLFLVFIYHRNGDDIYSQLPSFGRVESIVENAPANSTLGFGAVVVVSKQGSERRPALLQAANVTDIELTIPVQPIWTDDDLVKFKAGPESKLGRGSIFAWLGHHNALRWFLDSGLETALILEDDVDWDIRLRSIQAPLAATAARAILPPESPLFSFSKDIESVHQQQYWGNHKQWDLLYLGHCGDYFGPVTYDGIVPLTPENLTNTPHKLYIDPSLPSRQDLHPFTADMFNKFELPEQARIFHRSKFPLCSFGYAVTRPAAERLLTDLAPAKEPPIGTRNRPSAFDIALLHACVNGSSTPSPTPNNNPHPHPDPTLRHKYASSGLRCWSLNSELFHHMPGDSQIKQEDVLGNKVTGEPPVDHMGAEQVIQRGETSNIGCGFWSGAFKFNENDHKRLEYLQEEVGRKGKCLKEGRDSP